MESSFLSRFPIRCTDDCGSLAHIRMLTVAAASFGLNVQGIPTLRHQNDGADPRHTEAGIIGVHLNQDICQSFVACVTVSSTRLPTRWASYMTGFDDLESDA